MYLKLEISTRELRSLFWDARDGNGWYYRQDRHFAHCALCGAREYPCWFSLPYPWPRLHDVVTSVIEEQDGKQVTVLTGDAGASLYLPVEDAEMLGDTVYRYRFCHFHGRPETDGWVDCQTGVKIEWLPERPRWQQRLFNLATHLSYILWVAGRFLWSLLTLRFVSIRLKIKRSPW